jgi:hypothetical protein
MISVNFNQATGILETQYIGDITLIEIIDYIEATKNNSTYPRDLKILTDASQANMLFGHKDIDAIVNANNESLKNYNFIADALIIDKPTETALTVFFNLLAENEKYQPKVFSTHEGAILWLTRINKKKFA